MNPTYYIVADGNAYALDEDNVPFGAPVFADGRIDWDNSYDFSDELEEEEQEYIAHVCNHLIMVAQLTTEHNNSYSLVK